MVAQDEARGKAKSGPRTPRTLLAALRQNELLLRELAIRYDIDLNPEKVRSNWKVTSPSCLKPLLVPEMSTLAQEQMRVILLNTRHKVIGIQS